MNLEDIIQSPNIAKGLEGLEAIGEKVVREYTLDDNSRNDWKERCKKDKMLVELLGFINL